MCFTKLGVTGLRPARFKVVRYGRFPVSQASGSAVVSGFSSLFLFLLVERTSCNENGMRGRMSENGGDLSSFKWGQEKCRRMEKASKNVLVASNSNVLPLFLL